MTLIDKLQAAEVGTATQALTDLLAGRIERASVPGVWRVYRNEDDSAVLEVFRKGDTTDGAETPQS